MRDPAQEEFSVRPHPRWPTGEYLLDAFFLYLSVALLAALLFFASVVTLARPLWMAIFIAGVIAGIAGLRSSRRVLRRLGRVTGVFPSHA